jgi:hypothetical protein
MALTQKIWCKYLRAELMVAAMNGIATVNQKFGLFIKWPIHDVLCGQWLASTASGCSTSCASFDAARFVF